MKNDRGALIREMAQTMYDEPIDDLHADDKNVALEVADRMLDAATDYMENISDSDPRWVHLPPGSFALHIHPGGNAVIIDAGPGEGDIAAVRDWLQSVWPREEEEQ